MTGEQFVNRLDFFISAVENGVMDLLPLPQGSLMDELHAEWTEVSNRQADGLAALDAVAAQLAMALLDGPHDHLSLTQDLVDLHGALLVYELAGRIELLPPRPLPTFGFGHRAIVRRVLGAATRVVRIGSNPDPFHIWMAARGAIDALIGALDPELQTSAA